MTTTTTTTAVNLDQPYLGWLNHHQAGWQPVIVRLKNGHRSAYRLGDELPYKRATELCQELSETTGVPVAGELSKRDSFLPVAMGGTR